MSREKITAKLEKKLVNFDDDKLINLFNYVFPEEELGEIEDEEFKEEVVQYVINYYEDTNSLGKLYEKIFNEKISIEENFNEEEY